MLAMSQVNHIKDLSNCGYRICEIAKETGTDPKTIRKYLSQEDFSPAPPVTVEKPSILDPFKPVIRVLKQISDRKYEKALIDEGMVTIHRYGIVSYQDFRL